MSRLRTLCPALVVAVWTAVACGESSDRTRPDVADAADAPDATGVADASPSAPPPDAAPTAAPDATAPSLLGPAESPACASLRFDLAGAAGLSPAWTVRGLPGVAFDADATGLSFRAPAVARPTTLHIEARRAADDVEPFVSAEIVIQPVGDAAELALGLAPDCAPFTSGVASGDPTETSVVLWTRVAPPAPEATVAVEWQVATDPDFTDRIATGSAEASAATDHTVEVVATGLPPGTTLYYRFLAPDGTPSTLGRTRTLPAVSPERVRIASMSCSSLFSGYFNAYARLAERDDLDLVVHLGDYVYDFVDEEEQVRVPPEALQVPKDRAAWRARFRLYLRDPDLRRARAMHPWLVIWDNHDADESPDEAGEGTIEVFREYVPMRRPVPEDPRIGYRGVRFGTLLDLMLMDVLVHRVPGTAEAPADLLGPAQWTWLEARLTEPPTAWRMLGSQKLLTTLKYPPIGLPTASDWDDHPESRTRLFGLLDDLGDNVVLSGDLHFTIANDLVDAPLDPASPYDPTTGVGAVGVELLAAGITRGNVDESACMGPCGPGSVALFENLRTLLAGMNPHSRFFDLTQHGYGVLEVTEAGVTAELWYSPILAPSDEETLGVTLFTARGAHRWAR